MNELEAARGELRQAAVDYIGLMDVDHDDDAYVNALCRLEVAAEKFTDAKRKPLPANHSREGEPEPRPN